jgi:hypothetical protein
MLAAAQKGSGARFAVCRFLFQVLAGFAVSPDIEQALSAAGTRPHKLLRLWQTI